MASAASSWSRARSLATRAGSSWCETRPNAESSRKTKSCHSLRRSKGRPRPAGRMRPPRRPRVEASEMKVAVKNLDNKEVGEIELAEAVFGAPVRRDILARVVNWQLAKRRAGTHKTKGISDIQGTTKKPYKQKGTGRARQGSLRSPQFRGGARIFGPVVRSHAFDLQKKVRRLALKTALSSKQADGRLVVVDDVKVKAAKTGDLAKRLGKLGWGATLIIGGAAVDAEF